MHQLMNQLLAHIQTTGLTKAKLNAQVQAIIFYEKLGFSIVFRQQKKQCDRSCMRANFNGKL